MSSLPPYSILPIEFQEELYRREVPMWDIVDCTFWYESDKFRYVIKLKMKKPRPNLVAAMYTTTEYEDRVEVIDEAEIGRR